MLLDSRSIELVLKFFFCWKGIGPTVCHAPCISDVDSFHFPGTLIILTFDCTLKSAVKHESA
uniref:Uncharacterized protein n=1 Tax=Arundo donax TaxID=35708 RepID=A0A0A9HIB2_ARUDO